MEKYYELLVITVTHKSCLMSLELNGRSLQKDDTTSRPRLRNWIFSERDQARESRYRTTSSVPQCVPYLYKYVRSIIGKDMHWVRL